MSLTAYRVPTEGYDVVLEARISAEKPVILTIKGYDAHNVNSVYFFRELGTDAVPFRGVQKISAPMPISPEVLNFLVYDKNTKSDTFIKVDNVQVKSLKKEIVLFNKPDDYEFFRFVENFVRKCGNLPLGIYKSENEKFEIKISDVIVNQDGKVSSTPARVFRPYGNIEISKKQFDVMTIPMRMLILLHEYSHFRGNTREEGQADKYALQLYLSMGYPKSEAVYAFTKVFTPVNERHADALNARTSDLVNFIKGYKS